MATAHVPESTEGPSRTQLVYTVPIYLKTAKQADFNPILTSLRPSSTTDARLCLGEGIVYEFFRVLNMVKSIRPSPETQKRRLHHRRTPQRRTRRKQWRRWR